MTKVNANGDEETWVIKTFFTTEETFPTVLRRSEVIDIQTVEISPIETALTDVEQKTKDLTALHTRYNALAKTNQPVSTNALSMALNSAVDAPLNSGISYYRQTFLSPEYLVQNPERGDLVQKLREAIDDQVWRFHELFFLLNVTEIPLGPFDRQLLETSWCSMSLRDVLLPRDTGKILPQEFS